MMSDVKGFLKSSPEWINLQEFRETLYHEVFTQERDALFELLDGLLDLGPVPSFVELSLSPFFRREWASVYTALSRGRIETAAWHRLVVPHLPQAERLLLVADVSHWLLPEAETLPDRSFQHVASTLCSRSAIVGIGYAYSTVGVVPQEAGSWFLPLSQVRVPMSSDDLTVGAQQIRDVAALLPSRPVLLVDAKYGCGRFLDLVAPLAVPLAPDAKDWTVADPADSPVDVLARLKGNLKFYTRPPAYPGWGRPRVHGSKFKLDDPSTWPEADQEEGVDDPKWGRTRLRAWHQLHSLDYPEREVTLVLIERTGASGSRRQPKRLWLLWYGVDPPALVALWRWYAQRFTIEHWHRFAKQTLNWTLPHLGTPAQLARWGEIVLLGTWQLWLARSIPAGDLRRWQKTPAQPADRTPGQVRQGMRCLLAALGTPAQAPQRRGQAPGRPPGQCPPRKPRQPVVKKGRPGPRRGRATAA